MNNAEVEDEDQNNIHAAVDEELRNVFAEIDRRNNQNAEVDELSNNEEDIDDMNNAEVPEVLCTSGHPR